MIFHEPILQTKLFLFCHIETMKMNKKTLKQYQQKLVSIKEKYQGKLSSGVVRFYDGQLPPPNNIFAVIKSNNLDTELNLYWNPNIESNFNCKLMIKEAAEKQSYIILEVMRDLHHDFGRYFELKERIEIPVLRPSLNLYRDYDEHYYADDLDDDTFMKKFRANSHKYKDLPIDFSACSFMDCGYCGHCRY